MKYDIESIKKRKQNMKTIKKVIDVILIILIYNILLVAISCMNKIEPITIFGCKAYIITTNSMEPTIKIGDIVIIKTAKEDELKKGNVITFKKRGETITHRIIDIDDSEKQKQYTTKGDNNNIADSEKINYSDIEGKYLISIPYLGKFLMILENKIVFLTIVLVILILSLYNIHIQERKEKRREKKRIEETKNVEK